MGERTESGLPNHEVGTPGYPPDTRGYPNQDSERPSVPASPGRNEREDKEEQEGTENAVPALDLERFLKPREAAKLMAADQPVAHDGKAGWAVERATGRAIWIPGTPQYEVMARNPGARRDEPGLTDFPEHGGLPTPAPDSEELRSEARRERRKRVQIGLKLSLDQAEDLEAAAELFGVTRTTLARLLVVRGAREILERSTESVG